MSDSSFGSRHAAGSGATMGQTAIQGRHRVACLFETRGAAERAAADLTAAGISRDRIDVVDQGAETSHATAAETGGLWESIKRMFTGDDDVAGYYEGVNRGQTLLSVDAATADEAERAASVLERHDPIDLDAQEAEWRSAGWTGSARSDVSGAATGGAMAGAGRMAGESAAMATPGAAGATAANLKPAPRTGATTQAAPAGRASASLAGKDEVIPLAEENVTVGKRAVQGGRVRVRTHVVTTPVNEEVRLHDERVRVERRPVDQAATAAVTGDAFQERSIEMTETREEPVVSKTARVTEEVVLRQEGTERVEQVHETARHTEVDVEDERTTGRAAGAAANPNAKTGRATATPTAKPGDRR